MRSNCDVWVCPFDAMTSIHPVSSDFLFFLKSSHLSDVCKGWLCLCSPRILIPLNSSFTAAIGQITWPEKALLEGRDGWWTLTLFPHLIRCLCPQFHHLEILHSSLPSTISIPPLWTEDKHEMGFSEMSYPGLFQVDKRKKWQLILTFGSRKCGH